MPPRRIEAIAAFEERVRRLGDRLGPVRALVEQPRDDGFLELFLGSIDSGLRYALDLRDPSWDGVEERLARSGAVRVGDLNADAPFRYLRYRDPPWDEAALAEIAGDLDPLLADGVEVFCYFRHEHEPAAPAAAARLLELVAGPAGT